MNKTRSAVLVITVLLAIPALADEMKLGKAVAIKSATPIKEILSQPDKYLGKDIRIDGEITEVCQNMGCWINVKDASTNESIQVKVDDGEIVFPKDGAGRKVAVQGKLEKVLVSKEELEHQAKESGRKVDPSKYSAGKLIYRIRGEGAVIQ
ncbi:MAG TPA: DUF4920 domain-containing protein [Acidobacteriota bacterium]|nr:DUF4920 domain-containing protein [Acidobacteriota bacterium]